MMVRFKVHNQRGFYLLHCCWNKWFTIASYFNSFSTEDRTEVKEFLRDVSAEVAVLCCAEVLCGVHGVGGVGNCSGTGAGFERPNPNLLAPSRELSPASTGTFSLSSCFFVKSPMTTMYQ